MIITFNWLRDHLETNLTSQEIIDTLESLGLNLKVAYLNKGLWNQLEIVKIINKEIHPNADKLNLYTILKVNKEVLTLVCGDQELNVDDYVIYAKPGLKMPSGLVLKTAKIRGIESQGMLCSSAEINLPIQSNKVLRCFKEDFGKTVAIAYDQEGVFEIELTPNRGEAFSIRGIARLLSNENHGKLKEYYINYNNSPESELISIKSKDCKGIYCALFKHQIQPTPIDIIKRLQLTNHNIINLDLVDYTNYLSHELGQPMHVFDYEKIKNSGITVENLKQKSEFETLAGDIIELEKNSLVFQSNEKVIGWPCVIGGEVSKVDKNSTYILFETGIYNPDPVQRRKFKIITSAAKRTEYGLNPFCLKDVANKFLNLANVVPEYVQNIEFNESKEIEFDFNQIEKILGIKVSKEDFIHTMTKKGFIFNNNNTISPPDYKFLDINTPNCIIEEFALGMYQYMGSLNLSSAYPKHAKKEELLTKIALNEGFFECKNISLTHKEESEFNLSEDGRRVNNFSNLNYSILRGTLIPGLLKNFSWHIKNKYKYFDFFETGLIYGHQYINNQTKIFTAISNNHQKIRTLLTKILSEKNITHKIQSKSLSNLYYFEHSTFFYYEEKLIAIISTLKESLLANYNITECYSLEIIHDAFYGINKINTSKLSQQTCPIYKDITFQLKNQNSEIILNYLNKNNLQYNIKSVYKVNDFTNNITIEFILHFEQTLNGDEINQKMNQITSSIQQLLN